MKRVELTSLRRQSLLELNYDQKQIAGSRVQAELKIHSCSSIFSARSFSENSPSVTHLPAAQNFCSPSRTHRASFTQLACERNLSTSARARVCVCARARALRFPEKSWYVKVSEPLCCAATKMFDLFPVLPSPYLPLYLSITPFPWSSASRSFTPDHRVV